MIHKHLSCLSLQATAISISQHMGAQEVTMIYLFYFIFKPTYEGIKCMLCPAVNMTGSSLNYHNVLNCKGLNMQ